MAGQEEDPEDRRLQTTELSRIMRESPRPFVFLGYVVTKPHEGNYHILIDDANMNDIEPDDHDRWCEYIAFRGVNRVGYARISRGTITDTEVISKSAAADVRYKLGSLLSRIILLQSRVMNDYRLRKSLKLGDSRQNFTERVWSLSHDG
jgi:hypothetical protein